MKPQNDQQINQVDISVSAFIRVSKKDGEARERAMIILRDDRGKQWTLMTEDSSGTLLDLTVCDMPTLANEVDP